MDNHFGKLVVSYKVKQAFPLDPGIPFLGIYQRKENICPQKICIQTRSMVAWLGGLTRNGQKEIDENVLCLDRGGDYMVGHICQNSWNCTIKICVFLSI